MARYRQRRQSDGCLLMTMKVWFVLFVVLPTLLGAFLLLLALVFA